MELDSHGATLEAAQVERPFTFGSAGLSTTVSPGRGEAFHARQPIPPSGPEPNHGRADGN